MSNAPQKAATTTEGTLAEIVSHAKEYGFVFPSSEIYDCLAAVYDYGLSLIHI